MISDAMAQQTGLNVRTFGEPLSLASVRLFMRIRIWSGLILLAFSLSCTTKSASDAQGRNYKEVAIPRAEEAMAQASPGNLVRGEEPARGVPLSGLAVSLRVESDPESGKVVLHLEITNVGRPPRPFIPIKRWEFDLPGSGLSIGRLADARLVIRQAKGRRPGLGSGFIWSSAHRRSDEEEFVTLQPGESRRYVKKESLPPGTYEAHVLYLALSRSIEATDPDSVRSNTVQFVMPE